MIRKYCLWFTVPLLLLFACGIYNDATNSLLTNMEEIYWGVTVPNRSITGFTFITNMVLNFSVICVGMDFVNIKYSMYNMISVRFLKKSSSFWHYLLGLIKVGVILAAIFILSNTMLFALNQTKDFFSTLLLLSGSFFTTSMIWMCIICISFTFSIKYNIIFFEMILFCIISPIINKFNLPILSSFVPFPIDIMQNKYIFLFKMALLFLLLIAWNAKQKKIENI